MRPRYYLKNRVLEFIRTKDYKIWDSITDQHVALTEEYMTITPLLRERLINGCIGRLMSCIKYGITTHNVKYVALYHIKSQAEYFKSDESFRHSVRDSSYEPDYLDKEKFWNSFSNLAVEILTPKEYERLAGVYRDDKTLDQIAESQGVSTQAVHQVIARALKKLRKAYAAGKNREDFEVLRTGSRSQIHRLHVL